MDHLLKATCRKGNREFLSGKPVMEKAPEGAFGAGIRF